MRSFSPVPFLRTLDLCSQLSDQELLELLPFIQIVHYKPNSWIFREGDEGKELFILKSGSLEILKQETSFGEYEELGEVAVGEYFGEMAHLEGETRSASIRSLGPADLVTLDLEALQKDSNKKIIYSKIIVSIGKKVSARLRATDEKLIGYLRDKLAATQTYVQISSTIIYFAIFMTLWFNISLVVELFPEEHKPLVDSVITTILTLCFGLTAVFIIKKSDYPLSFYGLTLYRWAYYAFEGVIYSLPFIGLFILLKWVLIHTFDLFHNIPLFPSLFQKEAPLRLLLIATIYTVTTPVQELVARGVLQNCFRNFFQGPQKVSRAILVSNLLFQVIHTVKNFWLALASFFLGIFWGVLFEKQRSLVGVSVSHALIGNVVLFVLDYESLVALVIQYQRSH